MQKRREVMQKRREAMQKRREAMQKRREVTQKQVKSYFIFHLPFFYMQVIRQLAPVIKLCHQLAKYNSNELLWQFYLLCTIHRSVGDVMMAAKYNIHSVTDDAQNRDVTSISTSILFKNTALKHEICNSTQ
ncbi:MAG: hypothetical protein LBV41_00640 [Cytophagaceae bacterium]|jgi:hypothetical protein|nr:hypothetical protein [Cytophagaceae bacterium]